MKSYVRALIALLALSAVGVPRSSLAEGTAGWSQKMRDLYAVLSDLVTDVTSDRRFEDPANRARIQKEADRLAALSHDLGSRKTKSPDPDPTLTILGGMLARESQTAAHTLKAGNRVYARAILRSIPSYCIACHTRNATGPQFTQLPLEPSAGDLSFLDRAQFYAATRQFDRAQTEFAKVIQDPNLTDAGVWNWQLAVRQSLAIAVRAKRDPDQALALLKGMGNISEAPLSMKEDAKAWIASLEEWKREAPVRPSNAEQARAEVMRLMAAARELQKYPMDRSADVLYLRASAAAHDLLQLSPHGEPAAEGMMMAGLTYEVLSPIRSEDLHNLYYEACIRTAPHGPTADLCFRRLEEDVIQGYTGTAGTDLPEDARGLLRELRLLSQPLVIIKK